MTMTLAELLSVLKKKDKDVEVKRDSLSSFRVFIYSQRQKFPITSFLDRRREFEIIQISDYPKQSSHYPVCVVRVRRLRIMKKTNKRSVSATDTLTKTNIREK